MPNPQHSCTPKDKLTPHRARRAGPRCSSTQDKSLKGFQIASPRSEERLRSASGRKNKNTNKHEQVAPSTTAAPPGSAKTRSLQQLPKHSNSAHQKQRDAPPGSTNKHQPKPAKR
ncbi:hypothetical protein NDU88_007721 [Pleurodeles waltl]|uniref:Uncharacterized protein n=1 Tax=Pleurodeles waltl TaxID=8319 RepID=A0AAV7NUE8_PLEWA|nr:hypothetical protein NDU88_007721 [Pleurodeles waltl]